MADKLDLTGLDLTDGEQKLADAYNILVDEIASLQTAISTFVPNSTVPVTPDLSALEARLKVLEVRVLKPEELATAPEVAPV